MHFAIRLLTFGFIILFTNGLWAQPIDEFSFRIGVTINTHLAHESEGFNQKEPVTDVSVHGSVLAFRSSQRYDRFSYGAGIGYGVLQTTLNPQVRLDETAIAHAPSEASHRIGKLDNRDNVLQIPVEARFRIFDGFRRSWFSWPEIRFVAGLQSMVVLSQRGFRSEVYSYPDGNSPEAYPVTVGMRENISDYYASRFRNFSLGAYGGFGFVRTSEDGFFRFTFDAQFFTPVRPVYKGGVEKVFGLNLALGLVYSFE